MAKKKFRDLTESFDDLETEVKFKRKDGKRFDKKKRRIQEARKQKQRQKYGYLDS